MSSTEFDDVRAETEPLARARRATDLIALYQQRAVELARLRRVAIEEAVRRQGLTYTAAGIAAGLSKGRVSQLRKDAPAPERVFFGVGPVTLALPTRTMPDRSLPVISAEDSIAAERMADLLRSYGFTVEQFRIPPTGQWTPRGDVVAICGPKSSSVIADALHADPHLNFTADDTDRWGIDRIPDGPRLLSPIDDHPPQNSDLAYLGRVRLPEAQVLLIAGVHAIGSVGAVVHLASPGTVSDLYALADEGPFSCVVRSSFDGENITSTEYAVPPQAHR